MLDYEQFYSSTNIPPVTKLQLDKYIHHGEIPDRFLTSVLENKLKQSYANADDDNLPAIPAIVNYLYNNSPAQCWGNARLVDAWAKQKGMEGIDKPLPSPV